MLEHESLRIGPWSTAGGPSGRKGAGGRLARRIMDAASGLPLGTVYGRARVRPFWLRWLLPPAAVLEVHEAQDDSLLFTLHCGRPLPGERLRDPPRPPSSPPQRCWTLLDADNRSIGELAARIAAPALGGLSRAERGQPGAGESRRPTLAVQGLDWQGRTVEVCRDWLEQPAATALLVQSVLATAPVPGGSVWREQDAILLRFDEQVEGEPFLKMLILGAVLIAAV
jgi:hypothetical protein